MGVCYPRRYNLDKRKVFETLLYETEYANIADSKYVEERLSLLRKWIKDNMPTKLYRYRRCNENSISAFSKDEIWGSSYLTFNDSLECIPCRYLRPLAQTNLSSYHCQKDLLSYHLQIL